MRRFISTMLGVGFMVLLVACGGGGGDDASTEKYISQAEEVITNLNEGNYEAVHIMFNDEMKNGLPVEDMEELGGIIEGAGDFEKIDKSAVEKQDEYYVTVLDAKYSEKNHVYTISFNDDEEIVGLYIK